ncbi:MULTISPECIES: hypothetical protein [Comamonas]|uniref:hypothetical protein n=1 Tax=Comamonas TaxID=283 RepID=UPI00145DC327|nr:hypothetical protein [Comamonas suwonensis]MBI1624771.1 hypothetical protein [Comamonas suwonensis]
MDDDVRSACNAVDLDALPDLPASLLSMVQEGRRGVANPAWRGAWAKDLQAYAAQKGLTAVITPKFSRLRVMFFKSPDLSEHAKASSAMESIACALEVCSHQLLQ